MKIIFIFNLARKTPFFYELVDRLHRSGKEVVVYDFISSKKYLPETRKIESLNPFFGAKIILKIRYFRRLFIPLINRLIISQEFNKKDVVNIHYVEKSYIQYSKYLKKRCAKLIVTFWGSDFLRADQATRSKYIPLLTSCDEISMVEGIQEKFKQYYKQFEKKVRTSFFGLSQLDVIKKVNVSDIQRFKSKYNLTKEAIFITIGYNASPAQQHLLLIDKLSHLNDVLKTKIHILVPLTYGGDDVYKKQISKRLNDSRIDYTLFTSFLSEDELACLSKISNITLNIQETDAFSGSISESIFAGNIVLVGDWLPYNIYKKWGVLIFKTDLNNLDSKVIEIVENFDAYGEQIKVNSNKVYNKLSWGGILPQWQKLLHTS